MLENLEKNPFDELFELVGESSSLDERISRIESLLDSGKIRKDLNAILLAESLYVPWLFMQNNELQEALKQATKLMDDTIENVVPFPIGTLVN